MPFTARAKDSYTKEKWTYQEVFNEQVKQDLIDIESAITSGGANTALSNLTTTSINESLIPQANKSLGDSGNRWTGVWSTTGNFNGNVTLSSGAIFDGGVLELLETTAPSNTANYGKLYVKSSDSLLYFLTDGGVEYSLTSVGSGANVTLSNLSSPTAINQDLLASGTRVLGNNSTGRWTGLYSTFGNFSTTVDITGNLTVDTNVLFVNTSTNRVGINNSNPAYGLEVTGNGFFSNALYVSRISANPTLAILTYSDSVFDGSNILNYRARGTSTSSFSAVQSGDILGALQYLGANAANTWGNISCQIQVVATENHSSTAAGTRINFETVANTTTTRTVRFIINQDGSVTVGSSSGTGTGAFYAGATTITTLTGSGNVNIDSGLFYIDVSNDRIGVFTTSPIAGSYLTVGNGGAVATNSILAINGGSTGQASIYLYQNRVLKGIIGNSSGSGVLIAGTIVNDLAIRNAQNILFSADAGTTAHLILHSDGRIALGNSFITGIRATVGNGGAGSSNEVLALNGTSTGITGTYYYQNGTVKGLFGLAGASNQLITGSVQSDFNIRNSQSILFSADAGTTAQMKLFTNGNLSVDTSVFFVDAVNNRVGINTASPSYSLHCVGTSYFSSTITVVSGVNIESSSSASSFLTIDNGSGNAIYASRASLALHIDYDNSQTDSVLNFIVNNTTVLWSMNELGAVDHTIKTTTANGYTFSADSVTTGIMTRIISNSSNTSSRALLQIYNINTSATGAYPLLLTQNAVTSTNFKKYVALDSRVIWVSDGTDPNGTLSGTIGDLCLYATGTGGLKTCAGGTTWN